MPANVTCEQALQRNPHGHVYCGLGEEIKIRNIVFRALIHLNFAEYKAADSTRKRHMKLDIYQQVHQGGGRFLCQDGVTEMTEEAALKKIGRALTDAARKARLAEQQDIEINEELQEPADENDEIEALYNMEIPPDFEPDDEDEDDAGPIPDGMSFAADHFDWGQPQGVLGDVRQGAHENEIPHLPNQDIAEVDNDILPQVVVIEEQDNLAVAQDFMEMEEVPHLVQIVEDFDMAEADILEHFLLNDVMLDFAE